MTLIIGAVVGLVVVAFILLTENLASRLYPTGGAPWRRLVIPVAGALSSGYLLFRYFPNARGSGIPQTKTALFLRDGYIAFRTVVGKFGLSAVSLASGLALGREGPSVQVGAGIASVLGRKLGLSPAGVRALVPVGASAALAAAFNTPIAAVLFSLEEVMGDMHAPVLGSVVLSSATSWIVLHLLLGDEPLFHVPAYQLVHPVEFLWYAVLGIIGGLVSVAFVKLLLWQRKRFLAMPKASQSIQPVVGGLTVGILGWFVPQVLGVGYNFVGQALNGEMLIKTMALLVCLKVVATATCYASGNAGGIFGPSLFIGAMMGGAVGGIAHLLMPDYTGGVGAYALVGMGTAFAGIVRVPMTSVIMIFEITRDYSIIVPLMIANLASYFISSKLQEEPIYEALQHQDGIHLPSGERARQALLMVGNAFQPASQVLSAHEPIRQAAASVERERGCWPVVDEGGLRGMLAAEKLDEAMAANRGDEPLANLVPEPAVTEELTAQVFPHVHSDHTLDDAMQRIAESGLKVLPVVSRTNIRELKGTLSLEDILSAYRIGHAQAAQVAAAETPKSRITPIAATVAALVGVALVAASLNYFYRSVRTNRAAQSYRMGNELMAERRYEEAVAQYRNALSISHSLEDRLALGLALVKAEHPNEGAVYLQEVVRNRPDNAPAHLALANIAEKEGRIDEAAMQYRLAVDGSWPQKPDENRGDAQIQMIDMLRKAGRQAQARAALLALAADVPQQPAPQKRVAKMLLDFGMPQQAAALYRDVVQRHRDDADAYDGLGEADLASGDYAGARAAFESALKIDPNDTAAMKTMELCDQVLAMDPSLPGLNAAERYRRSHDLLARVVEAAQHCKPADGTSAAPLKDDLETAQKSLAPKKRPRSLFDAAQMNMALAEQLWRESKACSTADDALSRVLARQGQPNPKTK